MFFTKGRTHISYGQVKKGSKRVQKRAKKNFTKCKHGKHKRFTVHLLDHHQTKPAFPPITVFIHFNWFLIEMAACVQKEFLAHFLLIWSVLYLAGGETGLWRIVWVFYYFDFFLYFCILYFAGETRLWRIVWVFYNLTVFVFLYFTILQVVYFAGETGLWRIVWVFYNLTDNSISLGFFLATEDKS